uniref:Uncharacterized protein n=1 Tax=Zonotrichia albicollis TaxID=44394 RepID=A0A8D2MVE2_ZONAL
MQELVAGMERISLDSEADVEQLRAQALPFPGVDSNSVPAAPAAITAGTGTGTAPLTSQSPPARRRCDVTMSRPPPRRTP